MQTILSRWVLFGLLLTWSFSHAAVFAQPAKTAPVDKIRQGLDKVVSVDYTGQSLADAINHMREKSGMRINIDQFTLMQMGMNPDDNIGQVTVKGANEKVSQHLRRLLSTYNLTYVIFEDAVLITTSEMAIFRQFAQRVSVDLEDVPFKKAVRDLARAHGINLVIDPKVADQVDAKVTLQLDDTDIDTAIRLMAEVVSLKAVPIANVVFVTNEDKAKKLRDEDRIDNTIINPGIPRGMPMPGLRGGIQIAPVMGRAIGAPGNFNPAFFPPPGPVAPDGVAPPGVELPQPPRKDAPKLVPLPAPAPPLGAPPVQVDPPVIRQVPQGQVIPLPPSTPSVPRRE